MTSLYDVWNNELNLKNINISLKGKGIAGFYSGFWIRQWKIMLDAGLQTLFNPENIFITHTHTDHIEKLPMIITGLDKLPNIYIPKGSINFVINYLYSHHVLNNMKEDPSFMEKIKSKLIEVSDNDEFEIISNKKKILVRVFETDHTIESYGYAFSTYKKKLKEEFRNLPKDELKIKIKNKENLSEIIEEHNLIYTGDTRGTIFDKDNISWNSYKYIITECSFVNDLMKEDPALMANERGHNHLNKILEIKKNIKDPIFILVHFSKRYSEKELDKYFDDNNFDKIIRL
jgi:ribonuclease BN (tRNA processing enzyme)